MWDFFARLKNSLSIIYTSLKFLFQNKKLLIFPFLTAVFIYYILIFFPITNPNLFSQILNLIFIYLLISICLVFFSVALSHATLQKLDNKKLSIINSLKIAISKILIIIPYAIMGKNLSSIMMPHEHEKNTKSTQYSNTLKDLEKIIEFPWKLNIFLVPAIIADQDVHLTTLYKHAIDLLKKEFGDKITVKFSFYTINILFLIIGIILNSYVFNACAKLSPNNYLIVNLFEFIIFFVLSIIYSSQTIFKTCVYNSLNNKNSGIFTKTIIHEYFK